MTRIAVALLFFALPALGQGTATLACTPPTNNTDGSSITGTISYLFLRASSQTGPFTDPRTAPTCNYVWTGLAAGAHYFVARAVVGGVTSADSSVGSKLIAGVPPNPPAVPQPVTLAGPVFIFGVTTDALVRLEAGSVVAGRLCDPTQQIAYGGSSYMRVNASLVTPFAGQQILAGFAVCQ